MKKKLFKGIFLAFSLCCILGFQNTVKAEESEDEDAPSVSYKMEYVYRMYNPNTGEHFYTTEYDEKHNLVIMDWLDEGDSWYTDLTQKTMPVYRLYNENAGDHHYTLNEEERDHLMEVGWKYEGISFQSGDASLDGNYPVFRLYNPNAISGAHHYTMDEEERDNLISLGWKDEGIGWYSSGRPGISYIEKKCTLKDFSEKTKFLNNILFSNGHWKEIEEANPDIETIQKNTIWVTDDIYYAFEDSAATDYLNINELYESESEETIIITYAPLYASESAMLCKRFYNTNSILYMAANLASDVGEDVFLNQTEWTEEDVYGNPNHINYDALVEAMNGDKVKEAMGEYYPDGGFDSSYDIVNFFTGLQEHERHMQGVDEPKEYIMMSVEFLDRYSDEW